MKLAPIALFVYNRPWHTRQTIEALQHNELATDSDVFIFSDAAKTNESVFDVKEVRKFIKTISGFKSVSIIEQEENLGLADSIIGGVTRLCNEFGRVIVLEDDLVTSPYFLKFMNRALDQYAQEKKVWHISGWNYPIATDGLSDAFFWRVMNCWGWATWTDRWQYFEKNPQHLIQSWDKDKINRFNLDGCHDFWGQVINNASGKWNTWAIFWYATIFEREGLCLHPVKSYVENIGHDGSGENCAENKNNTFKTSLNPEMIDDFPVSYSINRLAENRISIFYMKLRVRFIVRIYRKFKRIFWRPIFTRVVLI